MRRAAGWEHDFFRVESMRVITDELPSGDFTTEATVKVWVGEERRVFTAEGNGPVNAIDTALRSALNGAYPAARPGAPHRLQGAHPRRRRGHRCRHPGPARRHRRRARLDDDRRQREHHRGVVAGARGEHRLRPAARLDGGTEPDRPRREAGRRARHPRRRAPGARRASVGVRPVDHVDRATTAPPATWRSCSTPTATSSPSACTTRTSPIRVRVLHHGRPDADRRRRSGRSGSAPRSTAAGRWRSPAERPGTAASTARTTACPASSIDRYDDTYVVKIYTARLAAAPRRRRRRAR